MKNWGANKRQAGHQYLFSKERTMSTMFANLYQPINFRYRNINFVEIQLFSIVVKLIIYENRKELGIMF